MSRNKTVTPAYMTGLAVLPYIGWTGRYPCRGYLRQYFADNSQQRIGHYDLRHVPGHYYSCYAEGTSDSCGCMRGGTAELHHPFCAGIFIHYRRIFNYYLCGGSIRGRARCFIRCQKKRRPNMQHNYWIYLFIMFAVTYLVRVLPLVVFKKKITNRFVRSFLTYIPYAVLAAMTFPAVFFAVDCTRQRRRCSGRCDCGTCGRQSVYSCHFCQRSGLYPFTYSLNRIQKQLNFILFCKIQLFFL